MPKPQKPQLNELKAEVEALEKRAGLYRLLFPQQIRFVLDRSKRKAALCSRRAGKTYSIAVYLLETALKNPESISVYIALTRLSAKRILWPILRRIVAAEGIECSPNVSELTMTLANGSQIWLTGADDQAQIEKLRGNPYVLAIIDEAASFGTHLHELVEEVLDPALLDHDGTLCMIGTPGAACVGKFHEVTTQQTSWSTHHWTVLDNPHIPRAKSWLENRRKENKWNESHPIYQREWLGRWVFDTSSLVYKFSSDNLCSELPQHDSWFNVLGIDLGFDDDTAFNIVSSSHRMPAAYVHSGWKKPGMDITEIAAKARWYIDNHKIHEVVIDTAGLGKMIAVELQKRHNLPVKPAEKGDKLGAIELMNGDLHSQKLMVLKSEPVLREWEVLQWNEKRNGEDPRFPNHCADAVLYAYRDSVQWIHRPEISPPELGTPEYDQAVEDELEEENEHSYEFDPYDLPGYD